MFFNRLFSIHHHRRLVNTSSVSYLKRLSSNPSSPPMAKIESDPSSIHNRVMMLIKLSNLDAAAEQARLAVFSRGDPFLTAETGVAIIDAMRSDRRYNDAYDLFHYYAANSKWDLITNRCSGPIIIAFCDEGKLDEALELYKHFLLRDRPSYRAQLALAQGLVDAGRIDEAVDKFYCVDRSVYGIFIRGFLDLGNLERANQLFQELKLSDDSDSVVQASAMFMEHWFKQEMDEKAMECYLSSKEEFSKIYATAANVLLKVLLRYGKQTEACLLFGQMMEKDRNPRMFDSESCNIMVNECFKLGKISEAVEIFHKSVGTVSYPQLCYRNLITKFCEQDLLSEAEQFFAEMCSKKFFRPDVPTYRTMMDAYVKRGRVSDAVKTVNQTLDASLTYIAKKDVRGFGFFEEEFIRLSFSLEAEKYISFFFFKFLSPFGIVPRSLAPSALYPPGSSPDPGRKDRSRRCFTGIYTSRRRLWKLGCLSRLSSPLVSSSYLLPFVFFPCSDKRHTLLRSVLLSSSIEMTRKYSATEKAKWASETAAPRRRTPVQIPDPSVPRRRAPIQIPDTDNSALIEQNKFTLIEDKDATNGRFRVSINGLQPLERTLELSLPSGGVKEVELEYEKLEKHCFSCLSLSLSLTKVMTVLQLRLPTLNAQPPWVSTKSGRWKN
ncbi:hypothetical protein F2Q69_00031796 [Brassica cretica]|uniref:Pentacotripeptide-repeat region of PRORP domain-containing protein n=1 Tax=Brassica cretica TaxID=69181 RepID=A0A8S9S0T5_BRACR|nr:hypothetical protein F2Q69_00031796 [Brassica cretica]